MAFHEPLPCIFVEPLRIGMQSTAIIRGPTLCEFAVDQDLVRLAGCELLNGVQWPSVQAMNARALLRQQQVWKVAVEEHLHTYAQVCWSAYEWLSSELFSSTPHEECYSQSFCTLVACMWWGRRLAPACLSPGRCFLAEALRLVIQDMPTEPIYSVSCLSSILPCSL